MAGNPYGVEAEPDMTTPEAIAVSDGEIEVSPAPEEPRPTVFRQMVEALGPVGVWRCNDSSETTFSDLTGTSDGAWVTGTPGTRRPTLVDDDSDGGSVDFYGTLRGSIPDHASHATSSGGVLVVVQLRDAAPKQAIINRFDGARGAGRWLIELTADGRITAKMTTAGGVVSISSPTGAVAKGVVSGIALTWGASGLRLYVGSGTPVATDATTQGAAGKRPISVGAWHTGADQLSGLVGWILLFPTQPGDGEVDGLMDRVRSTGIIWANEDSITVKAGTTIDNVDVLANDHFQGEKAAATLEITQQPSLATFSVNGSNDLTCAAGGTAGNDDTGRYRVNGSAPAVLRLVVEPAAPFFPTTDLVWDLLFQDPLLPHAPHHRLSEGVDDFVGHPALVHSITAGQAVDPMHLRVALPPAPVWLMRWWFALSAGYNHDVQPDDSVNNGNGAKTIGFADLKGADGGDGPATQQGYGCRVLIAGGSNGADWTFRPYSYHFNRRSGRFGQTFGTPKKVVPATWYEVALQCVINTGDNANGHLRFWVDRELLVERTDIQWFPFEGGNNGSPGTLPQFLHLTNMFGGRPDRQIPRANGQWYYRNFQLWTTSRAKTGLYLASS